MLNLGRLAIRGRAVLRRASRHRGPTVAVAVAVLVLGAGAALEILGGQSAPQPNTIEWSWAASERVAGPEGATTTPPRTLAPVGRTENETATGTIAAPHQIVVRFSADATPEQRGLIRRRSDLSLIRRLPLDGELLRLPPGRSVAALTADLEDLDGVLYAEPNFIYSVSLTDPGDPRFPALWGLHNEGQTVAGQTGIIDADIDAPEAWESMTSANRSVVAVVDTGVAYDHPDLVATMWSNPEESANGEDDDSNGFVDDTIGWDFVDDDADPRDVNGHGTHVAGTIAAERANGLGIAGVGENSVMALRVLDATGSGTSADIAAAFDYAGKQGADVVNGSFGGPGLSQAVLDAIARYPQTLFVFAAGNESSNNDTSPTYPCNYASVNLICVAATTNRDSLASFSNYGATSVDLAAPGAAIVSSVPSFSTRFTEDFDDVLDQRWTGPEGTWNRALDDFGYYLSDSPGTPYVPDADFAISTLPIDSSGHSDCVMNYVMNLDTEEDADRFLIEASNDGSPWRRVAGWTGSTQGEWVALSAPLPATGSSSITLRFRLVSDGQTQGNGVDLDDVIVRCVAPTYSGTEYRYFSGTSMAAPHVAGAAGALFGAAVGTSTAAIKEALLAGVDPLPDLIGRTLAPGRLNLNGAIQILGVSSSRPEPSPSATHTPEASETPSPSGPPEETPTPTPSPEPGAETGEQDISHPRTVRLRLRGHLAARGRVLVSDGYAPCTTEVRIVIRRNGVKVATATTDAEGMFRIRLPDSRGRYLARVPTTEVDGNRCVAARSATRGHAH